MNRAGVSFLVIAMSVALAGCHVGANPDSSSSTDGEAASASNIAACKAFEVVIGDASGVISELEQGQVTEFTQARLLAAASGASAAADLATGSLATTLQESAKSITELGKSLNTSDIAASGGQLTQVSSTAAAAQAQCAALGNGS